MKDCTHCKHAQWERTKAGRLHPSGYGMCGLKNKIQLPPLPACMRWPLAKPFGGRINRHEDLRTDCAFYERAKGGPV